MYTRLVAKEHFRSLVLTQTFKFTSHLPAMCRSEQDGREGGRQCHVLSAPDWEPLSCDVMPHESRNTWESGSGAS